MFRFVSLDPSKLSGSRRGCQNLCSAKVVSSYYSISMPRMPKFSPPFYRLLNFKNKHSLIKKPWKKYKQVGKMLIKRYYPRKWVLYPKWDIHLYLEFHDFFSMAQSIVAQKWFPVTTLFLCRGCQYSLFLHKTSFNEMKTSNYLDWILLTPVILDHWDSQTRLKQD